MQLTYRGEFNHQRLYEELATVVQARWLSLSSPIMFLKADETFESGVVVTVPDSTDPAAIGAVVAAHDPARLSTSQVAEANEQTLRQRADQAVSTLEQAHENWANLSAAQKDGALRLTVRVTVALARLQLRKLDNA